MASRRSENNQWRQSDRRIYRPNLISAPRPPAADAPNQLRVSNRRSVAYYCDSARDILERYGKVYISGIGEAIVRAVDVANALKNEGHAKRKEVMHTNIVTREILQGYRRTKQMVDILMEKMESDSE